MQHKSDPNDFFLENDNIFVSSRNGLELRFDRIPHSVMRNNDKQRAEHMV